MKATLAVPRARVVPVLYSELGSLHLRDLQRVEGNLYSAFGRAAEQTLVVDCRVVESIGAAFAGMLARLAAQARRMGGDVVLVDVSDDCRRVLERCGISHLCTSL
jgi:anti-anti-sigma factor